MRIVTRHAVAVPIVMFLVIAASAQVAWANLTPAGDITLVSTADDGTKGNGHSFLPSLSGDGATVAFHSLATNLDPGDTDAHADVYVKDLATGDIVLASTADDGTKGNGDSFDPSLSADGTTVAFGSTAANLDPADTDAYVDVYVKDLVTGDIALASITRDGTKGNNDSIRPSLSADGTRVAFESFAMNLDPADGDFDQDVYVKDLVTGEVILASSTGDGTKGNDGSSRPSLSADGTGVAFDSRATNLDPVDTDGCRDVYVKDLATGEITLASLTDDGTKGTCFGTVGGSSVPSLNADATKVAFESTATDLDPGDESFRSDIYVKNLTTHDITLATPTMPDVIGDQFGASISADGTRVGFGSCSLCEFAEAPFPEVFLKDLQAGDVARVSSADDGTRGNDSSVGASLSADGSRVAFQSAATNLDPADTDDVTDVYVKDLATAADNDDDGLPDQVEALLGTDPGVVDTDGDGIDDFVETAGGSPVDTDGDGIIDALDADSDGDGIPDANEGAGDTDGDGAPDYRDLDSDDDGLPDALEGASGTDRLDDDSDDDGIADGEDPDTIAAIIRSLPRPVFRSPSEGTRTAFLSRLEIVEAKIAAGDIAGAITDLEDLRRRVDGCDPTSSPPVAPDSNDWIQGTPADPCSSQGLVRDLIDLLIANLAAEG
jgi:Tol biopolymer transport system component